jgi:hypothetical protein
MAANALVRKDEVHSVSVNGNMTAFSSHGLIILFFEFLGVAKR